jgi:CXXC-20-CXXC protein
MNKQLCIECGNQFKWTTIFKNIWQAYKPLKCQHCEKQHKVTSRSQIFVSLLMIVPMLLFGELFVGLSLIAKILVMLMVGFSISLLVPFIVKYRLEPGQKA